MTCWSYPLCDHGASRRQAARSVWCATSLRPTRAAESDRLMEPSSEQADLPAEQPPPREDAWLPAAHAHPCRPGDHRGQAAQGPSGAVRLTARRPEPPCCRRRHDCDGVRTSPTRCVADVGPGVRGWSSISMSRPRVMPGRGPASWLPGRSARLSFVTASGGNCATWSLAGSRTCRPARGSWSGRCPLRRRPPSSNSAPTLMRPLCG